MCVGIKGGEAINYFETVIHTFTFPPYLFLAKRFVLRKITEPFPFSLQKEGSIQTLVQTGQKLYQLILIDKGFQKLLARKLINYFLSNQLIEFSQTNHQLIE